MPSNTKLICLNINVTLHGARVPLYLDMRPIRISKRILSPVYPFVSPRITSYIWPKMYQRCIRGDKFYRREIGILQLKEIWNDKAKKNYQNKENLSLRHTEV